MTSTPQARRTGRRLDGELLDVASAAELLGMTEKAVRARVARRMLPHRRWGTRVVFLRAELLDFMAKLAGCDVDEALENVSQRDSSQ